MLLIHTKGTTLTALSTAITIFVIAIDTFFQQVVCYPQRTMLQSQNSSIPRVINYEPVTVPDSFLSARASAPLVCTSALVSKIKTSLFLYFY